MYAFIADRYLTITALSVKIKGAGLTDGKEDSSPLHIPVYKAHPKN